MRTATRTWGQLLVVAGFAQFLLIPNADAQGGAVSDRDLVPAAMGVRTDSRGNSWNVESNGTIGRIGSTMVNSGLILSVNDENFTSFQPMMTGDGNEFVLRGQPVVAIPGLRLQRRIRLITSEDADLSAGADSGGGLRYAEVFYNGSTDPVSFTVALTTNFSGNFKHFISDRGANEPVILAEDESGIVVLPGASQSTKAFLFSLAGHGSSMKPTISAQNRYGLTFRYQVKLAPGETGVIMHRVAQVMIPGNFDRRNLLRLFSPYSLNRAAPVLDPVWEAFVLNTGEGQDGVPGFFPEVGLDSLAIEPGESDVLALGEKTRLPGKAMVPELQISNSFGEALVPVEKVAAVAGAKSKGGKQRVYLNDSQILTGAVAAPDFVFRQTGGGDIPIKMETLDRIVFARKEVKSEEGVALETFGGDRLLISNPSSVEINGVTPWGAVTIPLDRVLQIYPDSASPGYRAQLIDGSEFRFFPADEQIEIETPVFGTVAVPVSRMRSIAKQENEFPPRRLEPDAGESVIHLSGLQKLGGRIGNSELAILNEGVPIVTQTSEIRSVLQINKSELDTGGLSPDRPVFRVERWDGGIVEGVLQGSLLSVSMKDKPLAIPLQDIVSVELPLPSLNEENRARIEALIELLGDPSWEKRERATVELGAFGYLAGAVLRRERQQTGDVEVARRIDRVLKELQ